jgi:hypothetical protein
MHKDVRAKKITGTGGKDKAIVAGVLQRGGELRAVVVPDTRRATLQAGVREHVEQGSAVYSDALVAYTGLAGEYDHKVVDHAEKYVDGQVHVNGVENFWSLLKRVCTAPTSRSSPGICSATSTSGCSPTTSATSPTSTASWWYWARWPGAD